MELHKLFDESADKQEFLKAFKAWHKNSKHHVEAYREQRDVPEYYSAERAEKLDKALRRLAQPANQLEEPTERLADILNRVAQKLSRHLEGIEKAYPGTKNYLFESNAIFQIGSLPYIQQAALLEHVDAVRELLSETNNVVEFIGPRQPAAAQQQAQSEGPVAQMR